MKTNKSLRKRFKVTKRGQVLVRKAGHGHFNAKSRRVRQLAAKRMRTFAIDKKTLRNYLPQS